MDLDPKPIAILLVKEGSRGDKLLFKYPYCTVHEDEYYFETNEAQDGFKDEQETASSKIDAAAAQEQELSRENESSSPKRNPFAYTDPDSDPFAATESPASNIDKNGQLTGFTDKAISDLLAVKSKMCNGRFELQVNDVRFVGHPMLMDSGKTSLQMFHLAFVLNAGLDPEVVNGYYSLVQRLAVGLEYMDQIKRYLTEQVTTMLTAHEEATSRAMSDEAPIDPYDHIASSNELAQHLITIFNKLCSTGECTTNLGNWFNVSFVMPHKVYANLPVGKYFNFGRMCTRRRRLLRYMSVLLLRERTNFQVLGKRAPQFPLVTPSIKRVLDVISATSTLYKTAADADIVYDHLVDIVGHFAHWGMMMVIYPLCNKNLYVLSSKAIEIVKGHNLQKAYKKRFPQSNVTLLQQLQRFNTPVTPEELTEMATTLEHKYEGFFTILWLLECGLITQVHKFVYISVPVGCRDRRARRGRARDPLGTSTPSDGHHKQGNARGTGPVTLGGSEVNIRNEEGIVIGVASIGDNNRGRQLDSNCVNGSDALQGITVNACQDAHRGRRRRVGRTDNLFALALKRNECGGLEEQQECVDSSGGITKHCDRLVSRIPGIVPSEILPQKNVQGTDDKVRAAETPEERQAAVEEAPIETNFPTATTFETVDRADPDQLLRDKEWFNYDLVLLKDRDKSNHESRIRSEQNENRKKDKNVIDVQLSSDATEPDDERNLHSIVEGENARGSGTFSDQQLTSGTLEMMSHMDDANGVEDFSRIVEGYDPDIAEERTKKYKKSVSWGKPRSENPSPAAAVPLTADTFSTASGSSGIRGTTLGGSTIPRAATHSPVHGIDGCTVDGAKIGLENREDASGRTVSGPNDSADQGVPHGLSPSGSSLSVDPGQGMSRSSEDSVRGLTRGGRGSRRGFALKLRRGRGRQTSSTTTGREGSSTRSGSGGARTGDGGLRGSGGAGGKRPGASPGGQEGGGAEEEELFSLMKKARLTMQECCAALTIYSEYPDTISFKDMKTFLRLSEFFRGEHHIEEMMYTTNLSRGTILDVIDKFSLMLCVMEGPARNYPIVVD